MNRQHQIAVISIGYSHYAFEDAASALELMAILSKSVKVEADSWGMEKITPCTHFLAEDGELPQMKFVAAHKFNPHETKEEVKARWAREQADREDIDQPMNEAPAALPAPAVEDIPF